MKTFIKSFYIFVILSLLAQPINTMGMHYIRDFVAATTAKVSESVMAHPYKSAAFALGAAATVGLGYSLYKYINKLKETIKNLNNTAHRTYLVGDEKIVVPENAIVRSRTIDSTQFAYKKTYIITLPPKSDFFNVIIDQGTKLSNILQVFHESYNDNIPLKIIVHSNVPYNDEPVVGINTTSRNLVIFIHNRKSVERVDYIFCRPIAKVHDEKINL